MYKFIYNDIDFAHKLDERTQPSNDYVEHSHNFYELYFFLRGDVTYTVEKDRRKIEPGDIIIILPGDHHFGTINPDVPYERYVFKFPAARIPPHMRELLSQKSNFYLGTDTVKGYFDKSDAFYAGYETACDDLYVLMNSLLAIILIAVCKTTQSPKLENPASSVTAMIIDYVNENLTKPMDLTVLSEAFNYSQSYLSVEFKKHMQVSLMQYIRSKKIFAAQAMIEAGEKPTHVCTYFGFDEYSTFYRAYTKIIGSPPGRRTRKTGLHL